MTAIVNVDKSSSFSKYNGLTFEVNDVFPKVIHLIVNDHEMDRDMIHLNHKEIMIVDIQKELQVAYDNYNWGNDHNTYMNLQLYCLINNICIKAPEYNCPA
jgi:hypothetical protein